jgi:hypothetical protein
VTEAATKLTSARAKRGPSKGGAPKYNTRGVNEESALGACLSRPWAGSGGVRSDVRSGVRNGVLHKGEAAPEFEQSGALVETGVANMDAVPA